MKTVTYSQIRPVLRTMDLVFFHGEGFVQRVIQVSGHYCHVGMVIETYAPETPNMLLMWESTTVSEVPDIDGSFKKGVQTCFLSNKIEEFADNGEVYIRQIIAPRYAAQMQRLNALRQSMKDTPYEKNWLRFVLSGLPGGKEGIAILTSVFCSELAFHALQVMGWVDQRLNPEKRSPTDIAERTDLIGEAKWADMVRVKG